MRMARLQILAAFSLMKPRRLLDVCVRLRNDDNGTSARILVRILGGRPVR